MASLIRNGHKIGGGINDLEKFQIAEMPTPSESYAGKIYQYIGTTTEAFVNGYFYRCDIINSSYNWERITEGVGIECSQAEYDAWKEEGLIIQDTNYYITDGSGEEALQPKLLSTPISIAGASKTTVEEALNGFNTITQTNVASQITASQSEVTISSATLLRCGKLCQLHIECAGATLTIRGSTTLILSLASDLPKPLISLDCVSVHYNSDIDTVGHARMTSGGNITVYANSGDDNATGLTVWLTITYLSN